MLKRVINQIFIIIQKLFSYELRTLIQIHLSEIRSFWLFSRFKSCHNSVRFGKINSMKGMQYISIGSYTGFDDGLYLMAWEQFGNERFSPEIVIGNHCISERIII